jgi:hypothetical protein
MLIFLASKQKKIFEEDDKICCVTDVGWAQICNIRSRDRVSVPAAQQINYKE